MFSHDFFVRAFGDVVEHYSGTKEGVKGFHTAECAYGTWWNPPRPKKVVAHEDTTNPNYDHAAGRVIIK